LRWELHRGKGQGVFCGCDTKKGENQNEKLDLPKKEMFGLTEPVESKGSYSGYSEPGTEDKRKATP